jgi:hypothetical protein
MKWGVGLSYEIFNVAGAEAITDVECNMCGGVMRGVVALPGSKAITRTKGSRRRESVPDFWKRFLSATRVSVREPGRPECGRNRAEQLMVTSMRLIPLPSNKAPLARWRRRYRHLWAKHPGRKHAEQRSSDVTAAGSISAAGDDLRHDGHRRVQGAGAAALRHDGAVPSGLASLREMTP